MVLHPLRSNAMLAALVLATGVTAQSSPPPPVLAGIETVPPLFADTAHADEVTVPGWTFEPIGYATDAGRRRVVRIGPEGQSVLTAPERGDGLVLRGAADTARGDLVSVGFAMEPYRCADVTVRYRVTSGQPLVFVGLRPTADRTLVDLEFLPNRRSATPRTRTVRLHSGGNQGPYSLAVSIGGTGTVHVLSVDATETGPYPRPERPLCVLDIRSADPDLTPSPNFARVASVFGFPSVEYVHYTEYTPEKIDAIDPALLILPGLWSSKGLDHEKMDAAVLDAVQRDVPVVGICLGHQVLARAHGAKLGRASEWGPTEIEVVRSDPLFDGLPRRSRFFNSESHNYGVERPVGAMEILASSEACATQVFRYRGKPWYTFQGHIERGWEVASPEAVLLWKNMLRSWHLIPSD